MGARELQLFNRRDIGLDTAQDHAGRVALDEGADAKAADVAGADRELAFARFVELEPLLVVHHPGDQLRGLRVRQGPIADRVDHAIDLDAGRPAGRNKQVGGLLLYHHDKQLHEFHAVITSFLRACDQLRIVSSIAPGRLT